MANFNLQQILLEELGYANRPEFDNSPRLSNGRTIPDVFGAYSVHNSRVVYFSEFQNYDIDTIWQLHKAVWNESKAPLLYVILPSEVRIYNCYAVPSKDSHELDNERRLLRHLTNLNSIEETRRRIQAELIPNGYNRLHLDTNTFWSTDDGKRIQRKDRADQKLLQEMDYLRRELISQNISNDLAYILLGRSIFIRYLEDREILTSALIENLTSNQASSFLQILNSLDLTYEFFDKLSQRFNGDLFPVGKNERNVVGNAHLSLLKDFLLGTLHTGQLSFWPYDFKYIPIELISGIYDTFLNTAGRRKSGAYYTPLFLADFILEETLSSEVVTSEITVLDPACGSGIFLVGAYQRLIDAWEQQSGRKVSIKELSQILKRSIFGVDINNSALRIAAFSLYLAMLDRLDNPFDEGDNLQFPKLLNTNLLQGDFFSSEIKDRLGTHNFDRIVGNPPWGSDTLTDHTKLWLQKNNLVVGKKNIAQAFMMRTPEFCALNGEIALLVPTISTFLATGEPHQIFRKYFFSNYATRVIFNFAALRHSLFPNSKHPGSAIFFQPSMPEKNSKIVYGTPKSTLLSDQIGVVIIDSTEISYLSLNDVQNYPELWKVSSWGTHRDFLFIQRLKQYDSLIDMDKKKNIWRIREGIRINTPKAKKTAPWLEGMPLIPTTKFRRYILNARVFETLLTKKFYAPREPFIIKAPLALIHQTPMDGRCAAAFSDTDIVYLDSITGVIGNRGQEDILKWLVAYINSPLSQYYHFMTSSRWGVERDDVLQGEYKEMPFILPDKDDRRFIDVVQLFDEIANLLQQETIVDEGKRQATIQEYESLISDLIFDIYDLSLVERQLVMDTIQYQIGYFYKKPYTIEPPDQAMLIDYADTFINTATELLRYQDQTLNAVIYQDGLPLSVIRFQLAKLTETSDKNEKWSTSYGIPVPPSIKIMINTRSDELQNQLRKLDRILYEQRTSSIYMRKHVRIYDGSSLYLVRPSEARFWTQSQARVDADKAIVEWLSQPENILE